MCSGGNARGNDGDRRRQHRYVSEMRSAGHENGARISLAALNVARAWRLLRACSNMGVFMALSGAGGIDELSGIKTTE